MTLPPIDNSSHGLTPREPADEQRAYALVEAVTSMCAVIANRGLLAQAVSDLIGQHLDALYLGRGGRRGRARGRGAVA